MAHNNGSPAHLIHGMKKQLMAIKEGTTHTTVVQQHSRNWVTFTFHSPSVYKITNLFKRTNLKIAFRPTNTTYQQLSNETNNPNPTGIYQLKCNTCNRVYVGQSGRPITTRHREHLRYIKNNNSTSAYAMHILDNRHEFGPVQETLKLLKPSSKGSRMDCWESLFTHLHHKHNILIAEQQANDTNPLFELPYIPSDLVHLA